MARGLANTFFDHVDSSKKGKAWVQAPHSVEHHLPVTAGYSAEHFANDVRQMFNDPIPQRAKIQEVNRSWQSDLMTNRLDPDMPAMSRHSARHECAELFKAFHRFTRSEQRDQFMEAAGGDGDLAADSYMEYMKQKAESGQIGHGHGGTGMGKAMGEGQKAADGNGGSAPFGLGAGSKTAEMIAKAMRIAELLPKVRRKYKFAAVRKHLREVVPWPEDDIDYKRMTSYAEISKVPMHQLCQDDDRFLLMAANKEFIVQEHFRLLPEPKKFAVAVDVSGSMSGVLSDGYHRYEYATATAIALLEQSARGGNYVIGYHFDTEIKLRTEGTPEQVAKAFWEGMFSGGGTAFEAPFRAVDQEEGVEALILVSDGESGFNTPPKCKLQVLQCGVGPSSHVAALRKIADRFDEVV